MIRTLVFSATLALSGYCAGAEQAQGHFERTLKVSGTVDLDVETDSGGIVVTAGSPGTVQVRATLKAQMGSWFTGGGDVEARIRRLEQNPPIQQTGNIVRIGHVSEPGLLRGISMRLEISTPPQTKLRARADSGGVRVAGIQGPADCKTDSGGIEATDISGEVRAEVDSGGIRIRNVKGLVYARADSGGIEAHEIAGSVDAATDSGGIRISQVTPASIRARADSGGARIRLAPNGGYDIRANSDGSRITVPDGVQGTVTKDRVNGRLRGGGPVVDVQIGSGHIVIE
jgi:hypothetical protein